MAVYTKVSVNDLAGFVRGFDIGDVVAFEGIAQGIENSNFRLRTTGGTFVLTLYEKRVRAEDLPFFVGLMSHLAEKGFPCPAPIADRSGRVLHELSGRPAALVAFADGDWPRDVTVQHCAAVGAIAARLHEAAADFPGSRENDLTLGALQTIVSKLGDRPDALKPGLAGWIDEELASLESAWPAGLPTGIVHGDLFPDNVFFDHGEVSGVIDFYFACTGFRAVDIAVCLNAWCFDNEGSFLKEHARALVAGYQSIRKLTTQEAAALPVLVRGAAMRFLVTRLHDWFHTPESALARRKDPLDLVPLAEFHRAVSDSTAYGLD